MSTMTTRATTPARRPFGQLDRLIDDWFRTVPGQRWGLAPMWTEDDMIRVDEFREADDLVIRAELPGIDPANDVTLTAADGVLRLQAERRTDNERAEDGYRRRELHYGSLSRVLGLPEGVDETAITASYKDGILEIRIPLPTAPQPAEARTIPVSTD